VSIRVTLETVKFKLSGATFKGLIPFDSNGGSDTAFWYVTDFYYQMV
jgi:hypothetical protein